MAQTEPIIEVKNVSRNYIKGTDDVHALSDVSLKIEASSFVALMGPSGSGKSTLLNLVSGIDRPSEGFVGVAGSSLSDLDEDELALWRARGLCFYDDVGDGVAVGCRRGSGVCRLRADGVQPIDGALYGRNITAR